MTTKITGLVSSGMWRCTAGRAVSSISTGRITFILKGELGPKITV